jgi:hypothetical protein
VLQELSDVEKNGRKKNLPPKKIRYAIEIGDSWIGVGEAPGVLFGR